MLKSYSRLTWTFPKLKTQSKPDKSKWMKFNREHLFKTCHPSKGTTLNIFTNPTLFINPLKRFPSTSPPQHHNLCTKKSSSTCLWNIFISFLMKCLEDYNQKIRGMQKHTKIGSESGSFPCVKLFSLNFFRFVCHKLLRRKRFFVLEANIILCCWKNRTGKYLNMNEKYFNLNMKWTDIMAHKLTSAQTRNKKFFKFFYPEFLYGTFAINKVAVCQLGDLRVQKSKILILDHDRSGAYVRKL